MKRIIALAAFAVSLSAFAAQDYHSWFDLLSENQPMTTWPSDGSNYTAAYKCVVTNTAAASLADSRLSFNAEAPLAVIPMDQQKENPEPAVISEVSYAQIKATMRMEPFLEADVPAIPEGAKTAAIAVISGSQTNFWVAAGIDELFWTNTCVAADVTKDVAVEVTVTYGLNCVNTQWNLDGTPFTCKIATVAELHGVNFLGQGSFVECWADAQTYGTLVDFWLNGVPTNVFVTATTTNGSELVKTDLGVYRYIEGAQVNLSFTLPVGWKFYDGLDEWTDKITNLVAGAYLPFAPTGIFEMDFGPENEWMSVAFDGAVSRFATVDEALAGLKDSRALVQCYSANPSAIEVAPGGKSITVGGVSKPAKGHYHYESFDGMPVLLIDDGEADITSIAQDDDPDYMSVGTIENCCSGFKYSVLYADDPAFTQGVGSTEPVAGTEGAKLELKAPKGDNGGRFYKISIAD